MERSSSSRCRGFTGPLFAGIITLFGRVGSCASGSRAPRTPARSVGGVKGDGDEVGRPRGVCVYFLIGSAVSGLFEGDDR